MPTLTPEAAKELASKLRERWSEPVDIGDGFSVRAKIDSDWDSKIEDYPDCFGTFHWPERDTRGRPSECNGAARKIDTRQGPLWWQPPKDVLSDPEGLASVEKRVRAYFFEHWSYASVVVEVTGPACDCCGERKTDGSSLWGIESDAGDYFAEVLADLVSDVLHQTVFAAQRSPV